MEAHETARGKQRKNGRKESGGGERRIGGACNTRADRTRVKIVTLETTAL